MGGERGPGARWLGASPATRLGELWPLGQRSPGVCTRGPPPASLIGGADVSAEKGRGSAGSIQVCRVLKIRATEVH